MVSIGPDTNNNGVLDTSEIASQQAICNGFFFSSRRRHTRSLCDWSSDVCSSDLRPAFSGASHPDTKRREALGRFAIGLEHRGPRPVGLNLRPPAPHRKDVMGSLIAAAGALWIAVIMWDAFEALVLPRRVTRRLRPTRMFYRVTWRVWSAVARRMRQGGRRETCLSFFGPLSLLVLLAAWAASLVAGFALLQTGLGASLNIPGGGSFTDHLYLSGETFFTLGLGDIAPVSRVGRVLVVIEAGIGFAFLALVIGYLPILYQSFSRREVSITLLDARAGSPPSAEELLLGSWSDHEELTALLREWERWSAEVLESHLSYPVLSYYRSQHDNQSWLTALTTILDASALVIVGIQDTCARQA